MVRGNTWFIPSDWHLHMRFFLSNSLQAFPPPNSDSPDQPTWKNSADGNLSLAMVWDSLRYRGPVYTWHKIVCHHLMQPFTAFFSPPLPFGWGALVFNYLQLVPCASGRKSLICTFSSSAKYLPKLENGCWISLQFLPHPPSPHVVWLSLSSNSNSKE